MNVALCRVSLRLHGTGSLKQKRRISLSLISRINNRFNVSVAEIEDNDLWQRLTLGICCVSNDGRHANSVISRVVNFICQASPEAELLDYDLEMSNAF